VRNGDSGCGRGAREKRCPTKCVHPSTNAALSAIFMMKEERCGSNAVVEAGDVDNM